MNVHPFPGEIGAAQIEALRRMGIQRIRMTLGLHSDLAGPTCGLCRRGVHRPGQRLQRPDPLPAAWPSLVRQAVGRSPGLFCYEILNEPVALSPSFYVENYLRPAYEIIKSINPAYRVAAGAPTGTSRGSCISTR